VGQYLAYDRLWNDPSLVVAVPLDWPSLVDKVNQVLAEGDAAAYFGGTPVADDVEERAQDVFRETMDGLPGVQGWRAACRMVEAEHLRSDLLELHLPSGLSADARKRFRAREGLRILRAHQRAWLSEEGNSSIIGILTEKVGSSPTQPPLFIQAAATAMAAIEADPTNGQFNPEDVWRNYNAAALAWLDSYLTSSVDAAGEIYTRASNPLLADPLTTYRNQRVDGISPSDAEANLHAVYAGAKQTMAFGFVGLTQLDAEAKGALGCATFMAVARDPGG
jgi:hypothetical protein